MDSRSRDAFFLRTRVLRHGTKQNLPNKEGRRSAERRISNGRAAARPRALRSPLAFRRSTAALAGPDVSSIGSAPDPRFLRHGRAGRYPAQACHSLPSTSETGHCAGRSGTQSRPGAVCKTARGHRARSTFRIASGTCPLRERADSSCTPTRDKCQDSSFLTRLTQWLGVR